MSVARIPLKRRAAESGHQLASSGVAARDKLSARPVSERKDGQTKPVIKQVEGRFVPIPRQVLWHPPVRDYRTLKEDHVTPFEFAVIAGCIDLASGVYRKERHQRSLVAGKRAIDREIATGTDYFERLKRHREQGGLFKTPEKGRSIKSAGQIGYRRETRRARPPDVIHVQTSRSAILRRAGLPDNGTNLGKVRVTLDRLLRPVGGMPAPLIAWTTSDDDQLHLQFRGQWLAPPYGRVPIPLPMRSSTAMALFLWALTVELEEGKRTPRVHQKIRFEKLCRRLGIPTKYGVHVATRALDNALKVLNVYLDKLPKAELNGQGVTIPNRYEIKGDNDGYVRLTGDFGEQDDDDGWGCR
jgi:hypothetical protein